MSVFGRFLTTALPVTLVATLFNGSAALGQKKPVPQQAERPVAGRIQNPGAQVARAEKTSANHPNGTSSSDEKKFTYTVQDVREESPVMARGLAIAGSSQGQIVFMLNVTNDPDPRIDADLIESIKIALQNVAEETEENYKLYIRKPKHPKEANTIEIYRFGQFSSSFPVDRAKTGDAFSAMYEGAYLASSTIHKARTVSELLPGARP